MKSKAQALFCAVEISIYEIWQESPWEQKLYSYIKNWILRQSLGEAVLRSHLTTSVRTLLWQRSWVLLQINKLNFISNLLKIWEEWRWIHLDLLGPMELTFVRHRLRVENIMQICRMNYFKYWMKVFYLLTSI